MAVRCRARGSDGLLRLLLKSEVPFFPTRKLYTAGLQYVELNLPEERASAVPQFAMRARVSVCAI